ncbi:helix-turn-helix transcriptional regulator [Altererythrobacter sp. GH1-8]|uniref:helix-turn-helix transcriptional regulator n=1 Tax=Altererythrobacter sp. GH1-8 TaxID=3349333 RepID=UPI00374CB839
MSKKVIQDTPRSDRHIMMVAAIVVVQAVAAIFFLADAVVDVSSGELGLHIISEVIIAFALIAGVVLGAWQAKRMIEQARRDAETLLVARGAVADLIGVRFQQWRLSEAEAEVALFALKGCEVEEIAKLRNVTEGTVRAQLTSVYSKSGVSSRHGLLGLFFEDLIEEGINKG